MSPSLAQPIVFAGDDPTVPEFLWQCIKGRLLSGSLPLCCVAGPCVLEFALADRMCERRSLRRDLLTLPSPKGDQNSVTSSGPAVMGSHRRNSGPISQSGFIPAVTQWVPRCRDPWSTSVTETGTAPALTRFSHRTLGAQPCPRVVVLPAPPHLHSPPTFSPSNLSSSSVSPPPPPLSPS